MSQNISHLDKKTLIYGLGGLLNRFINFLLLPIFTAYLSPADYGIIAILALVTFCVTPIFSLGFGAAMAPCYYAGGNQENREKTVWTAFTILFVSCSFLAGTGIAFSTFISRLAFQSDQFQYLVIITILSTCFTILNTPLMLYLQFEERAKQFIFLSVITSLTSAVLCLLMVVFWGKGVKGFIEAALIAQAFSLILFLSPVAGKIKYCFSYGIAKELLRLGIPLVPAFAFLFVMQDGNKYLLKWLRGFDTTGIYTIGFNLGMAMNLAVLAFQRAWLPFFMSFIDRREEAGTVFGRATTYYVFGFGALSLLFFIAAKPTVMIMTQKPFHDAYQIVGLSACAQFLIGIFYILLPGIYFSKEVKFVTLIQAVAALITVVLNLFLIRNYGMFGAGIGLVIGFLSLVVLTYIWNQIRKGTYGKVQYQLRRLGLFAVIYLFYVVIMLWERNLARQTEVIFSIIILCTLPIPLFAILDPNERALIWKQISNFYNLLKTSCISRPAGKTR